MSGSYWRICAETVCAEAQNSRFLPANRFKPVLLTSQSQVKLLLRPARADEFPLGSSSVHGVTMQSAPVTR